jgi:hypothetical protein
VVSRSYAKILDGFEWEKEIRNSLVVKEPIGVVAMITPWNWPMNQVMCKVAPAIAAGCTMVLKPSEFAPLSAQLLAEIIHEAGLPAGVFNMVHGDGAKVGPLLSSDPRIDVVSLTGSTRAGESVSREAAATIKRVSLELGGKSANILLDEKRDRIIVTDFGLAKAAERSGGSAYSSDARALTGTAAYRAPEVAKQGWRDLLNLTAFLSINLAILNLLPIPALDGGRIMFALAEMISRRRIPPEKEALIHFAGFVILIGFMIIVTFMDISNWIAGKPPIPGG